jgi:heme/copper-type cytochrome/quinol oxidase subunit 3
MTASARPIATTRSSAGMPTGRLAVWWVIASEIVIFGGIIASYVMHRLAHDAFAQQAAHTNTWIGAFNTFVLLTSSLSAVLAHKAADHGDGKTAAKYLFYTIGGGATFLIVKAFEWTHEIREGFTITSNTFWSFYYTAAGIHASLDARKMKELQRVEYVGLYWHFVDVVWIFLFPLLYIAK